MTPANSQRRVMRCPSTPKLTACEAGLRWTTGRLRISLDAFAYEFEELQATTRLADDSNGQANVGEAETSGIDFAINALLFETYTLPKLESETALALSLRLPWRKAHLKTSYLKRLKTLHYRFSEQRHMKANPLLYEILRKMARRRGRNRELFRRSGDGWLV